MTGAERRRAENELGVMAERKPCVCDGLTKIKKGTKLLDESQEKRVKRGKLVE